MLVPRIAEACLLVHHHVTAAVRCLQSWHDRFSEGGTESHSSLVIAARSSKVVSQNLRFGVVIGRLLPVWDLQHTDPTGQCVPILRQQRCGGCGCQSPATTHIVLRRSPSRQPRRLPRFHSVRCIRTNRGLGRMSPRQTAGMVWIVVCRVWLRSWRPDTRPITRTCQHQSSSIASNFPLHPVPDSAILRTCPC